MGEMKLYRVINPFEEKTDVQMDTLKRGLTPRLQRTIELTPVFDLITTFWKSTNCQLETAVHAITELDLYGHILESTLKNRERLFSAQNINQQDLIIFDVQELFQYIFQYDQVGIYLYREEEWAIWEYLWERNRMTNHPQCVSRQNCLFAFSTEDEAKKYLQERHEEDVRYGRDTHMLDKVCKVEVLNSSKIEVYDMRWLDNLSTYCTYGLYEKTVNNYWDGRMTKNPLKEVLFQGTYILRNV